MSLNLDSINFFKPSQHKSNKKIILFGAGLVCKKILNNFDKSKVLFIVDNNKSLWKTKIEEIEIKSPQKIKSKKNIEVVITTTSFADVIKQIKKINHNISIKVSNYLKDLIHIEFMQNLKKTFLVSSGLPSNNNEKFGGGLYRVELNGLKWNLKKVYSGAVHGVIKIRSGYAISDSTHGVILLDKKFKIKKKGKYPMNTRAHGIAFDDKNKKFYVACSNTDKIKIFNNNLKLLDTISISDKYDKYHAPQHHINDLCILDQKLYVSMFSLTGNFKRGLYDGGVFEIDILNKKNTNKLYGNLTMPHSIKNFDGQITLLDSLKGELLVGKESLVTFSGFSRGLSFDGNYYYVGQSRNRNFSLLREKKDNISIDNSILIYDINNKISRNLYLPISEIHEVLTI